MLSWLRRLLRGRSGSLPPGVEADALVREALAHQQAGRYEDAERRLYRALALAPGSAGIQLQLGGLFRLQGRRDAALDCCLEAVRLAPGFAPARNNLGNAYRDVGRWDEALAEFRKAVELDDGMAEAQFNLGVALQRLGQEDEALARYRTTLRLRPAFAAAQLNLGLLLEEREDVAGAIAAYREALAAEPDMVEAHVNLGMQLLLDGQLREGFREYEWRRRYPEYSAADIASVAARWEGGELGGRTILLEAEQGYGDAIQFLRYAQLVEARGGRVLVRCAPELAGLAASTAGVAGVVPRGSPLPACDAWCPLPSLPHVFDTTLESIPAIVPYVHADPARAARWRERLAGAAGTLRVGLVWASQSGHRTAPAKSVPLERLAQFAVVDGVRLYGLQKGEAARELQQAPAGTPIEDLSAELTDFSETAAVLANLDLVISVDTAVAHLAGAMGRPAWTLLKFAPDWRWLREREDCPWYPTMRLFRQSRRGDWEEPIGALREALRQEAGRRR
jgi:tetratricopeptide (TPR) repeat protein